MRVFLLIMILILLSSCSMTTKESGKINGVSFVASGDSITAVHTKPVADLNANYASVMPFGFIKNLSDPNLQYNFYRQWFGETKAGVKQYIEALQSEGIKIMVKPQVWVWQGEFTGLIQMTSEDDWKQLEANYSKFILDFAEVAQDTNAELLCIGTELELFIKNRPEYWKQLIIDISKVYKGKLTYAANWDEYPKTTFWDAVDYIGIDGYFPVSDMKTPTVEATKLGLQRWKTEMKTLSETYKKQIVFTEYGYRSVDYTGKEPWKFDRDMDVVNFEAQTNTTQAFLDELWQEDYIAGGFIWKWFHLHNEVGGKDDSQFTPQNKPVEEVIRQAYSRY